jgi:mRNA interferase RelE/StbE
MDDYRKLDGSQKLQIAKQLVKLEKGPGIGKQLGSKMGIDLTGYFKLYADKKRLRIVYTVEADTIITIKVIAIGQREDMEAYRLAWKRITEREQ